MKNIKYFLVIFITAVFLFLSLVSALQAGQKTAELSPTKITVVSCQNEERCKEIDDVWKKVRGLIGLNEEPANKVYDPLTGEWVNYDVLYPAVTPSELSPMQGIVNEKKIVEDLNKKLYDIIFLTNVEAISKELGINPLHLMALMRFESGGTFDPAKKNPLSSAVGLIQFTESTAKALGTTTSDLAKMTQVQQLVYVKKYLENKKNIRPDNFGDLAMAIIWPKAIGEEDSYILFSEGSGAYEQNKNLDINNNGEVTRGEYIAKVLASNHYDLKLKSVFAALPPPSTPLPPSSSTPSTGKFTFVVISDTNGGEGSLGQPPAVEKAISVITNTIKPAFVISTGDMIAGGSTVTNSSTIQNMWQQFYGTVVVPLKIDNILFFPSAGNHDAGFLKVLSSQYQTFWNSNPPQTTIKIDGGYSTGYSFDYSGWHFVVLYLPDFSLDAVQKQWLENNLNSNKEKNTFVFGHVQLAQLSTCPNKKTGKDPCRGSLTQLLEVLKKYPQVKAYFHGHQQVYYKGVYEKINVVSAGHLGAGDYALIGGKEKQKPTFVIVDVLGNDFAVHAQTGKNFSQVFDESTFKSLNIPEYSSSNIPPSLTPPVVAQK